MYVFLVTKQRWFRGVFSDVEKDEDNDTKIPVINTFLIFHHMLNLELCKCFFLFYQDDEIKHFECKIRLKMTIVIKRYIII